MGPRNLPQEQPQQLFEDAPDAQAQKAQAELEATVLRFWDTVRKSADVIVTLRQENAILQAQVQSLRKSETELQSRVQDFLERIADLETRMSTAQGSVVHHQEQIASPAIAHERQVVSNVEAAPYQPDNDELNARAHDATERAQELMLARELEHEVEVRSLRKNIDRLEDELNRLQNELNEAQGQLTDHKVISQQLAFVRTELEARTKLLQDLQITLEENRNQRQLDIFSSVVQPGMAPAEMVALASRLDVLSGRISSLFGIS
ncbi:MAG: hypothetical protein SGJ05_10320 [bacterium]|nr:hypothetical protein [bacterium]